MSKYTTEVRFICETAAGYDESKGFDDVEDILTAAAPVVFNFDFPIFDETYRLPLERKILRHYYTREIGEESVGLWKLRLDDKLNMIMPYYNKLYESEMINFNPMWDVDLHSEHEGSSDTANTVDRTETGNFTKEYDRNDDETSSRVYNRNDSRVSNEDRSDRENVTNNKESEENNEISRSGASSNTQTREGNNKSTTNGRKGNDEWNLYSDTPQGGIQGIERASDGEGTVYDSDGNPIGTADVANNAYLTSARHIIGNETTTNMITNNEIADKVEDDRVNSDEQIGKNNVVENATSVRSNDVENNRVESGSEDGRNDDTRNWSTHTDESGNETKSGSEVGSVTNLNEYTEHVFGKRNGLTFSKMLMEFRDTFLNIDKMIIDELKPLFMNIW